MEEVLFKPIPNTNGRYVVYRDGTVKNTVTGKYIVGDKNNCGYPRVSLAVNGKQKHLFRHRLVAEAFVPNPDPSRFDEIDHDDGNKDNSHASNLRWVDRNENERAARRTGLKADYKPIEVVFVDGTTKCYETRQQLADEFGITRAAVKMWLHTPPSQHPNRGYLKRGIKTIREFGQIFR